jgi:hypothetical protein
MDIIYYILEDDGTIWDSQIFIKNYDVKIQKKEYYLYKRHMFPTFDTITGELLESDGMYVQYKNNIYLVDRIELFKTGKDLPDMVKDYFGKTLENPEWVSKTTDRIKNEIIKGATSDIESPEITKWFLTWMLRRFPDRRDFINHFEKLNGNLKPKQGVVYGVVDIFLTKLCRKIGWIVDTKKFSCIERDGKWNRIINYFVKFAPLVPTITYRIEEVESEEDVVREEKEDKISERDFNDVVKNIEIKFCNEKVKWWNRKREAKLKQKMKKLITEELMEELSDMEELVELISNPLDNPINVTDTIIIEKILDCGRRLIDEKATVIIPVNRLYDLYNNFTKRVKYPDDLTNKIEKAFEILKQRTDPDEAIMYLTSKQYRQTTSYNIIPIDLTNSVSRNVRRLIASENLRIFIPIFSDSDLERICYDRDYRLGLSSIFVRSAMNSETGKLLHLGSCSLYGVWYIGNILTELWYLANILKTKHSRETMLASLNNTLPNWKRNESEWSPSSEEEEFSFPMDMNLLAEILRFTWNYCLSWNVDILVGPDSLSEWIALPEMTNKVGLFLDIKVVAISDDEVALSLLCTPILKGKSSTAFVPSVFLDSFSSNIALTDSLRTAYIRNIFKSFEGKFLFELATDEIIQTSIVKSITINLVSLVYFCKNQDKLLELVNSKVSTCVSEYFNGKKTPISKSQEVYFKRGKMPSQLSKFINDKDLLFRDSQFTSWIKKLFP